MKLQPLMAVICCLFTATVFAQNSDSTSFTRQEIIYDHKDGMALTMTVLTPQKSNGRGIISLNSGNWVSNYDKQALFINRAQPFVNSGYTVFVVMHGSAPRYAIDDAVLDVQRAVQFIRYNAAAYKIDSLHIGITGTSSGGHLSLMIATADDIANPKAEESFERVSSKVQAAAVFAPPTDFMNYGGMKFDPVNQKQMLERLQLLGAFEFKKWEKAKRLYVLVEDKDKIQEIVKSISPAQLVTPDDAPTYIMHGDKDFLVPLQQSQLIESKLKEAKVPVTLTIKPGAGHGWKSMVEDEAEFVNWFNKYLQPSKYAGNTTGLSR